MRALAFSRAAICNLLSSVSLDERVGVISITDRISERVYFDNEKHSCPILKLAFHDISEPVEGFTLFSQKMAVQIVDFSQKLVADGKAQVMLCHCVAGVSRSAAVAAALDKWLVGDDSMHFGLKTPNMLVYRTIVNELHDRGLV